jgi:integrase
VFGVQLPWLDEVVRPRKPKRLPTVLNRDEVVRILSNMEGRHGLMARPLNGSGMRLMECMRLRVKDVDLQRREILVREGKGNKDRVTMLPEGLLAPLAEQLARARLAFERDRRRTRTALICRMRWNGSTPMPAGRGAGSGCSRPTRILSIRVLALFGVTTCTKSRCSARFSSRCGTQSS